MADSQYVGWWSRGEVEDHQEPILAELETDRHENEDGLFIFFESEEDARTAAGEGLSVVAVDSDVERAEMDEDTLRTAFDSRGMLSP